VSLIEAIGEGTVRLFSSRKRILGILLLIAIAAATWRVFFYMSPEEKYWWHIEESKRLVNASWLYMEGYYRSNDTETAKRNIEKAIELTKKAKEHVLLAIDLADTYPKKKYAELLAESIQYAILSREKLAEIVYFVEQGDEEGAKRAGKEAEELIKKAELKLIEANGYLSVIQGGEQNE